MSYFTHFPSIGYTVDEDKAKLIKAKNILVRAKFSDYVKTNNSILLPYRIKEGERPDTIAATAYGRADLHWIILLFNEIINPYHEWPLVQSDFDSMISLLYAGTTLYVRDDSVQYEKGAVTNKIPFFEKDSKIYQNGVSATVISYNSTFGQLIVDDIQGGEFEISTADEQGTKLGAGITQTNSLGNSITAIITKKELTPYSVHHFEDENGNWLDPRSKFVPTVGATNGVSYRPYPGIPKSLINLYSDPVIDQQGNPTQEATIVASQVVTNMDYEYAKNEEKTEIKILRPAFLDDVLKQFGDLFKTK